MFKTIVILHSFFLFFLFSCSSDKKVEQKVVKNIFKTRVKNFLNNNNKVIAFGHADIFKLLNKSEYNKNILSKTIVDPIISKVTTLDQKSPVYFAVEYSGEKNVSSDNSKMSFDPLTQTEGFLYAFVGVSDKMKLKSQIEQIEKDEKLGFNFKSSDGIDYFKSENTIVALMDGYLMLMADFNEENEIEISQLKEALKLMDTEKSSAEINKAMESSSDFMFTINMGKSVELSLNNIVKTNIGTEKIKSDLKGCFNITNLDFDKGQIQLTTENILSPAMSKWKLTKSNSKEIVEKLGSGSPDLAMAMNLDMNQFDIMFDTYFKSILSEIESKLSDSELIDFNKIKTEGLSTLFSGKLGLAGFLNEGGIPYFNFQLGTGPMLQEKIGGQLDNLKLAGYDITTKNNVIYGYFNTGNNPSNANLTLPEGAEDFGNYPINGFLDFKNLPLNNLGFDDKMINIVKNLSILKFKVEGDKLTLEIKFKDKSKNSIAQIIAAISGNLL